MNLPQPMLQDIYSAPAHHGPAVVAGHVLPGLNGHHQPAASSAAAFVEESNPPKIRVVVRKRPLNTKVSLTRRPASPCQAAQHNHPLVLLCISHIWLAIVTSLR